MSDKPFISTERTDSTLPALKLPIPGQLPQQQGSSLQVPTKAFAQQTADKRTQQQLLSDSNIKNALINYKNTVPGSGNMSKQDEEKLFYSNQEGLTTLGKKLGGSAALTYIGQLNLDPILGGYISSMSPAQFKVFKTHLISATKMLEDFNKNPQQSMQARMKQQAVDNLVNNSKNFTGHFMLTAENTAMNSMGISAMDKLINPQGSDFQTAQAAQQQLEKADPNHPWADLLGKAYGGAMGLLPGFAGSEGGLGTNGAKYMLDSEAEQLANKGALSLTGSDIGEALNYGRKLGLSDNETAGIIKGTLEQQAENQPSLREIIESLPLKTEGAGDTIGEGNARDFAKSLGVPSTLTDEEAETNDLASSSMSIKKIESSYLKSNDINAHELKSDIVGNKNMSKYDLYVETDTGEIFVFKKDGIGEGISTGIYIK